MVHIADSQASIAAGASIDAAGQKVGAEPSIERATIATTMVWLSPRANRGLSKSWPSEGSDLSDVTIV